MSKIIGIDLGTTNSCVATMEGKESVVILNREGDRTTPSMISFSNKDGSGDRKVGMPAKRQAITNPKHTIYSIKRFMGKTYNEVADIATKMPYQVDSDAKGYCLVRIGDRSYTPQELSAMILQELKEAAGSYLGQEVREAVITVPAYFSDQERQATKEAGEIAGLKVVRIINEPTAAALAFGFGKKDEHLKIVVYDLGGGTFDISILECEGGVFEVKATNGDVHLGGDDFDQRIINWLAEEFKAQEGIDLSKDSVALQRLKEAAERAKKELSTAQETEIRLPFIATVENNVKNLEMRLTRSKFEQLCDDLIERTLMPCQKALEDSGFSIDEIDEVILVGGSTRIPKIQQQVADFFKKKPSKGVNPDEVVALGAAVQGEVLSGGVKGVVLLDVTPLSLGIETMGGVFTKLIEANTTIPTKKSQIFSTAEDNQTSVDIKVFQGERPMAHDNKLLGRFHLDGIAKAPRGKPQVEVTFDIDVNGIVCVSAKDKDTGKAQDIRIEASSSLSKEEIERMKKEAEIHAAEDKKRKEEADKLNRADQAAFHLEKTLKEYQDKLSDALKKDIEACVKELKEAYAGKKLSEINKLLKRQEDLVAGILADAMKANTANKQEAETKEESTKASEVKDAEFEEVKDQS